MCLINTHPSILDFIRGHGCVYVCKTIYIILAFATTPFSIEIGSLWTTIYSIYYLRGDEETMPTQSQCIFRTQLIVKRARFGKLFFRLKITLAPSRNPFSWVSEGKVFRLRTRVHRISMLLLSPVPPSSYTLWCCACVAEPKISYRFCPKITHIVWHLKCDFPCFVHKLCSTATITKSQQMKK